jgi:hypothetical protein
MDSYAISRAEGRIQGLELEMCELKFEARRLRQELRRVEWDFRTCPTFVENFLFPMIWLLGCSLVGLATGALVAKAIQAL